jgi:leucyl-tRNA synthetase
MDKAYDFKKIEKKWQLFWQKNLVFKTDESLKKPKYYVLDMFPYPSGSGLHVGHSLGYVSSDIISRYKRVNGFNVLHPMGWDGFGLPAEQYAIKTGQHPRITIKKNTDKFRKQIKSIGLSYDWQREINTTDPNYYKWTQWIFLKIYQKGLAYKKHAPVNWCPKLKTVLANEEVIDGKSEIGSYPVEKKYMKQWILKITDYAERLLDDLKELDWPKPIKDMQKNWIGKSYGADINFKIAGKDSYLKVFTTRPDTIFGVTFIVLAPEHNLIKSITESQYLEKVNNYIKKSQKKSDLDRISEMDKTGVFTGSYAINPVNNKKIPIYISDYVLINYGYGSVMSVPAHDQRDYLFAKKYDLEIIQVIENKAADISKEAYIGEGILINSDFLNGLSNKDAIKKSIYFLENIKQGNKSIKYRLRDWLFSRQRYWGEPFPLACNEDDDIALCSEDELPVLLPELSDFKPDEDGNPPLNKAGQDWLNYKKDYKREVNTMPQWAGSCWYYLRYLDPKNKKEPWTSKNEKYWMPVDLYIGGAEHAVLHLLYARFWHKVLYDLGLVSTKEPFKKLVNQGMILGEDGEKMSKSKGNTINPDDIIDSYGADSFRLYVMFMGPLESSKPWNTKNIIGIYRFLNRVWRFFKKVKKSKSDCEIQIIKRYHKMIQKVTQDTESLNFNTAISSMMEFVNLIYKKNINALPKYMIEGFIVVLSPYAPHIAEELWEITGHDKSMIACNWPDYDKKLVIDDLITYSIQINGKHKTSFDIEKNTKKEAVLKKVRDIPLISNHIKKFKIIKEIFVQDKILNFVLKIK